MPATANRSTLLDMRDKLASMGGVTNAMIGEPKRGVVPEGTVAIIPVRGLVDETVLNAPREIHNVTLRRYANAMRDGPDAGADIEFELDEWRAEILEDIWGDFDLGGTIAYALPTQTTWAYGYQEVERTWYRLLDIELAYRIDPTATFTK